jgi:hypothetical protein
MRISLESTITIGQSFGPETDQGSMVRLLGEMAWFPTSFPDSRDVTWGTLDADRARATLRIERREVSAVFEFGKDGLPRISADRYRFDKGKNVLTSWSARYSDFRTVGGLLASTNSKSPGKSTDSAFPLFDSQWKNWNTTCPSHSERRLRPVRRRACAPQL